MTLTNLRTKNKSIIVNHLRKLYKRSEETKQKEIDYLVAGGDLESLIDSFKYNSPIPFKNIETIKKKIGIIETTYESLLFNTTEAKTIQTTIKNTSSLTWSTEGENPIYLSYHWQQADGEIFIYDGLRTSLAAPIRPGEKQTLEITILPPNTPGFYKLEITLVCEGQYWLENHGLQTKIINVDVTEEKKKEKFKLNEKHEIQTKEWQAWLEEKIQKFKESKKNKTLEHPKKLWVYIQSGSLQLESMTRKSISKITPSEKIDLEIINKLNNEINENNEHYEFRKIQEKIRNQDTVIFIHAGDLLHPDFLKILEKTNILQSSFSIYDFYFIEGELTRPIFLSGVDSIHGNYCDYFQTRFFTKGKLIKNYFENSESISVRSLALYALRATEKKSKSGTEHLTIPLICANNISNEDINKKRLDIIKKNHSDASKKKSEPSISAIICTKNSGHLLRTLTRDLLNQPEILEVIIISNRTTDPFSIELLKELSKIKNCKILQYEKPFNFSIQSNLGAKISQGRNILFINDDIIPISNNWLTNLLNQIEENPNSISAPLLLYPNQTIQHAGMHIGFNGCAGHSYRGQCITSAASMFELVAPRKVSCLTGAVMLMSRELFENLNGFDPMMATMLQDVDLSLRALFSGATLILDPRSVLFHMESISIKSTLSDKNIQNRRNLEYAYFSKRWGAELKKDRWINPNLCINDENLRTLN